MPRRQIIVRLVELFAGRVNKEPWFTFWVAAATGLFTCLSVFILTRWLALPDTPSGNYLFHDIPPGGLRVFLSFILPAASCLPSLAHAVMLGFLPASGGRTDPWPSRLDLVGSLALLLLIPLVFFVAQPAPCLCFVRIAAAGYCCLKGRRPGQVACKIPCQASWGRQSGPQNGDDDLAGGVFITGPHEYLGLASLFGGRR